MEIYRLEFWQEQYPHLEQDPPYIRLTNGSGGFGLNCIVYEDDNNIHLCTGYQGDPCQPVKADQGRDLNSWINLLAEAQRVKVHYFDKE